MISDTYMTTSSTNFSKRLGIGHRLGNEFNL